jgi:hypothetical protein
MDWDQAQSKIRAHVRVGTDLNTPNSTYRFVESVDSLINSERYGYHNERGFTVPIGRFSKIKIPWSMLKECFFQVNSPRGYDGAFFRERFPLQAQDHPCHIHVVGQIFVTAGIAQTDGKKYLTSLP